MEHCLVSKDGEGREQWTKITEQRCADMTYDMKSGCHTTKIYITVFLIKKTTLKLHLISFHAEIRNLISFFIFTNFFCVLVGLKTPFGVRDTILPTVAKAIAWWEYLSVYSIGSRYCSCCVYIPHFARYPACIYTVYM